MRITFGLAAMASLCLLAGCNKGAATNGTNAAAPAANAAEPVANNAEPVAVAPAPANAAGGDRRASQIAECVSDSPGHLPAGTDATAFCTCAVDKMVGGNASQRDAVNQCAAEMNVTLPAAE
jgi:hypothetical protein